MGADSTLDDVRGVDEGPPSRWPRRAGLAVLFLLVVAGACGLFGVHSRTIDTRGGEYRLSVTYPQVARAGLDVPFRIEVRSATGFAEPLIIGISADWFRMFETQGFFPDADTTTSDGDFVYFTYEHPRGTDFVMDYDTYVQPAAQLGKSATVKLIVKGKLVAETTFRTWLVP